MISKTICFLRNDKETPHVKQFLSLKSIDFQCEKNRRLRRVELFNLYHEYESNQFFLELSFATVGRKNTCRFPTTVHCCLGKSEIKQPKSCLSSVDLSLWRQRLPGKRKFDLNSFFVIPFKCIKDSFRQRIL